MSITREEKTENLEAKVVALAPAVYEDGPRKGERKLAQGREYTMMTVEYSDGTVQEEPLWTPFETAEVLVPIGAEGTVVKNVKLERRESFAGFRVGA